VTVVGVPIGGMVGSIVAGWIVPAFGWRAIFVVGAILPALLAAVLYRWLPESPRYLATRPDRGAELARLVNRVGAGASYDGSEVWTLRGEDGVRPGVKTLFGRGFRYNTLLIWLIFCTNVLAVYSFFNWVPTLLAGAGLPLPLALRGSLMFNLGGVVGSVGGALLMSRLGSRRVITALALLAVVSTYGIGRVPLGAAPALVPLYVLILLAGAAISGLQVNMYTVTGNAYPTRVRATGVGAALASARLGGVLSAYTGTFLMGVGGGLAPFFTGLSLVLLVTLVGVLLLRCHLPPSHTQNH
jgi:AAHS family 4-hydroxybenzoate transporter-like MFS transporter